MLDAMRRNTKIILWITVIFFVLLIFLVWGADLQFGGSPQQSGAIGTINGEPIAWDTYQRVLSSNREQARAQGRELRPSDELLLQEQTWSSLVDEILLRQAARERGLTASDEEVRTVLLFDPPPIVTQNPQFQNEQGVFDIAAYRALLQSPNTPESFLLGLEAYVRDYLPQQKLQDMITSGAKVSEDEIRRTWVEQNERSKVSYVLIDHRAQPISQDVTEAELEAHFQATIEDYRLPQRASLRYVVVPRSATAADSQIITEELRDLAREARQGDAELAAGNATGNDFETLVLSFSEAPNAEQGGLSNPVAVTDLSADYRRVLGGLEEGEISEPFAHNNFFQVLKVESWDRAPEGAEARVDSVVFRNLNLRIAPTDSSIVAIREELEALRSEASVQGLEGAAAAAGFEVQTADNVTASGIVPGLSAIPRVASFALDNPPGTLSRVYETNSAWFLVEVASHSPAGDPALEEVVDRVRQSLLDERRYEAARAVAERVLQHVAEGDSLAGAALAESLTVSTSPRFNRSTGVPGLGREPEVVAAAFTLPVGEVSAPLKAPRGWVVLEVVERPELDWESFEPQREYLRRTLLSNRQNQVFNAWMESLRKNAKVEDLRS
jgi:peptidyl-prolyl cis-trans isomerase D